MMTFFIRVFLLACLAVGSFGCGESVHYNPVDPPDQFGSFDVGYLKFTALDASRADRPLPVEVWYPVDPADARDLPKVTYPLAPMVGLDSEIAVEGAPVSTRGKPALAVFSHGYGGISNQSLGLMETLASHGFVVASPEHTGNAQGSMTDSFDEAAANRVPDVSFVIDTMIARNRDRQDLFYQRLDESRIGVVGHSFGGMTAIGMAAGWAGAEADPRVKAVVPISAVIDASLQSDTRDSPNAGFDSKQLAGVVVPVMLMGGTADTNVLIENNDIAYEHLVNAPAVYEVGIIGAVHTHFTSVCLMGDRLIELGIGEDSWPGIGAEDLVEPYEATCTIDAFPIDEATRLLNLYVVSFFKKFLLEQIDYQQYLTRSAAKREPAIEFRARG